MSQSNSPMESPFEINENSEKRYMEGWINQIIRWYYYVKEGVNQATALKTLVYVLIGIAGLLTLKDAQSGYWIIGLIGIVSIPIFGIIGWMWVTRGKKSEEYYQVRYTSPFGRYGIQMSEKQMKNLDEINTNIKLLLEEIKKNNSV